MKEEWPPGSIIAESLALQADLDSIKSGELPEELLLQRLDFAIRQLETLQRIFKNHPLLSEGMVLNHVCPEILDPNTLYSYVRRAIFLRRVRLP